MLRTRVEFLTTHNQDTYPSYFLQIIRLGYPCIYIFVVLLTHAMSYQMSVPKLYKISLVFLVFQKGSTSCNLKAYMVNSHFWLCSLSIFRNFLKVQHYQLLLLLVTNAEFFTKFYSVYCTK